MTYLVFPIIDVGEQGERRATGAVRFLESYYGEMQQQGLIEHAFYDGCAKTFNDFERLALDITTVFLFVYKAEGNRTAPIAHCHLTNIQGYAAMVHFNILREFQKECKEMMAHVLKVIFNVDRQDGTPFVTSLMGLTPMYNKAARKVIRESGFRKLTVLDKACYLYYKKVFEDGLLSIITREEVNG